MKFSKIGKDVEMLLDMIYAPMYTQTLFAGIELDIFSKLEEPKKLTEIAENLELHPQNTMHLLNALTAMDLFEKNNGRYKNKEVSNKCLVRGGDFFIGDHIIIYNRSAGFDIDMVKLVKNGPTTDYTKKGLESDIIFDENTDWIKRGQNGGRACEIVDIVSSLTEFNGFKKMLDLGGGPGLIALAIIKSHPNMKGVIFDTPDVGKIAEDSIKEYNLEKRVEVFTGDYITDSIGGGYDFILAIGTLNFAKQDIDRVLKKLYDALNPKGVFMCISDGLTNEKTQPKNMVIGWLPNNLKGNDFSLEQGEISDAALRNGFKSVYKQSLSLLIGDVDLDIARK